MNLISRPALLGLIALSGFFTAVYAATPTANDNAAKRGNSYYIYTKSLHVDDSGVVKVPSRFKWNVETSWSGIDLEGKDLSDSRVMLRLHDPDHNFTALTAQMDLATAAKLHHELGTIIMKKIQNPDYQNRKLYDPKDLPRGEMIGVDENGVAIIKLTHPGTNRIEISRGPSTVSD